MGSSQAEAEQSEEAEGYHRWPPLYPVCAGPKSEVNGRDVENVQSRLGVTGQKREAKGQASKDDGKQEASTRRTIQRTYREPLQPDVQEEQDEWQPDVGLQDGQLLAGIRSKVASKGKDQGRDQSGPAITEEPLG